MSRKALLVLLYFYAFAFSVLKTVRLPNDWSEAHWMLDYRFGFIKRGLAGEVFGWFFEKSESNILVLSGGVLFLLYALIFIIAVKETGRRKNSFYSILFFLTFFLSQYLVFSAHLIGYLDHVVFLMTVLSIFLIRKGNVLVASAVAGVSIFIHEISFFLLLPVSCFALIVTECGRFPMKSFFSLNILKKLALLLSLPVLATFAVSTYQEMSGAHYFNTLFNYLNHIPFIAHKAADSVSSAYTKSFSYYFKEQSGHFIQRLFISRATVLYGIPVIFSLWMIFKEFRLRKNFRLFALLAVVSFVPLLLHAVAYDTYRIWSFPFMIIFLGFWILSSKSSEIRQPCENISVTGIASFVISFALITLIPNFLFDDQAERFSLPIRLILVLPMLIMLYFIKKAPIQKD
ncbi:hypothetical protein SD427_11870 [Chryseobacterium sp. JJR-5R]|uniref:hypothetical protein n=1 Tax=Chryseobacterium sp. JJR-5R TaxID=3093923 RepID=UPI002A75348C|nr:hypothetical protein [Chryseobacterium sp. JJR-5R]WPO81458.1 hypothetical protein SD427_11870 [Chryseobacterium sp. JJR-5R]